MISVHETPPQIERASLLGFQYYIPPFRAQSNANPNFSVRG